MVAKIFLCGCSFPKTFPTLAKYFVVPYISVCPQVRYVLAVGVKYWNKQGGKCLCEEQDREQLFSFLGILGSG